MSHSLNSLAQRGTKEKVEFYGEICQFVIYVPFPGLNACISINHKGNIIYIWMFSLLGENGDLIFELIPLRGEAK